MSEKINLSLDKNMYAYFKAQAETSGVNIQEYIRTKLREIQHNKNTNVTTGTTMPASKQDIQRLSKYVRIALETNAFTFSQILELKLLLYGEDTLHRKPNKANKEGNQHLFTKELSEEGSQTYRDLLSGELHAIASNLTSRMTAEEKKYQSLGGFLISLLTELDRAKPQDKTQK